MSAQYRWASDVEESKIITAIVSGNNCYNLSPSEEKKNRTEKKYEKVRGGGDLLISVCPDTESASSITNTQGKKKAITDVTDLASDIRDRKKASETLRKPAFFLIFSIFCCFHSEGKKGNDRECDLPTGGVAELLLPALFLFSFT